MYAELLRIPIEWHGIPVFGFGIALAVWLAASCWALASMARQTGWPAALASHLPTMLIVAAVITVGIPRMAPDGVPIRGYGVMMLAGIAAGVALALRRAAQAGLQADEVLSLALWVVPGGAIGGRVFYVVQYWGERIRQPDVWSTVRNVLAFTEGGLVVYGAFLGAMAGFAIFVWRHKLPALLLADIAAPAMMAGLALGRVGCLLNGCCYGGESHAAWAITFPRENHPGSLSAPYAEQASVGRFYGFRIGTSADNSRGDATRGETPMVVIAQVDVGSRAERSGLKHGEVVTEINGAAITSETTAHLAILDALTAGASLRITTRDGVRLLAAVPTPMRSLPIHPTQIYSAIDAALLAWVLWTFYPLRRHDGEVMALMLMLHPISRFLLESIRVDEAPVWGTGLSISQNLSIGLFAVGLSLWLWLRRGGTPGPVDPLAGPQVS